jgi:hypothetical protein
MGLSWQQGPLGRNPHGQFLAPDMPERVLYAEPLLRRGAQRGGAADVLPVQGDRLVRCRRTAGTQGPSPSPGALGPPSGSTERRPPTPLALPAKRYGTGNTADTPKVEEIVAVTRGAGDRAHGLLLTRTHRDPVASRVRIQEALALTEGDLDHSGTASLFCRSVVGIIGA